MPGYVILDTVEVIDEALFAEYRQRVTTLLEAQGGKFVMRGDVVGAVGDSPSRIRVAVMEFETIEKAREWDTLPQQSPEYASLRELRERAARVNTTIVNGD